MINKKISEIIRSRRSIFPKEFNGKTIHENIVIEILENANYAPTHKMTQPWKFKIFSNASKKKLFEKIININKTIIDEKRIKLKNKFDKTSHIICICMQRNNHLLPEWEEIAATAMAVQNIWLSCVGSNIGGYWSTPKYINKLSSFLNLNDNEVCLGFFYLGEYSSNKQRKINRKSIHQKTEWYS